MSLVKYQFLLTDPMYTLLILGTRHHVNIPIEKIGYMNTYILRKEISPPWNVVRTEYHILLYLTCIQPSENEKTGLPALLYLSTMRVRVPFSSGFSSSGKYRHSGSNQFTTMHQVLVINFIVYNDMAECLSLFSGSLGLEHAIAATTRYPTYLFRRRHQFN